MLTVRCVVNDGHEDLFEVHRISTGEVLNVERKVWEFQVYGQFVDREEHITLREGSVFVMNSVGKTVAVYRLPQERAAAISEMPKGWAAEQSKAA